MSNIDLDEIRKTIPAHGIARLIKHQNAPAIQFYVQPPIPDNEFDAVKQSQRAMIPQEAFSEIYTEEIGRLWFIFLNRTEIDFIGLDDEDIQSFTGINPLNIKKT